MFPLQNALDLWMKMKLSKQTIVYTIILVILYAWILGLIGIYGDVFAMHARNISLTVLKYGLIAFGFVVVAVLPYNVSKAISTNKEREEAFNVKKQLDESMSKQQKLNEYIKGSDKYE